MGMTPLMNIGVMESPFAKGPARTIQRTVDGRYLLNGTLVANPDWTPEVGETVVALDSRLRPGKTVQYYPPDPKQAPNLFSAAAASMGAAATNLFGRR